MNRWSPKPVENLGRTASQGRWTGPNFEKISQEVFSETTNFSVALQNRK